MNRTELKISINVAPVPTYEYACKQCGEHLEVVQSFTDDALTECPNCGGDLRKVFGAVGVTFKGSGFYKTDSRKPAASSKSSDKSSDKSDSSTTEPSTPKESTSTGDSSSTTSSESSSKAS